MAGKEDTPDPRVTKLSDEQIELGETSSPDNPVDAPEEAAPAEKKAPPKGK